MLYYNIGIVYYHMEDNESALKNYRIAIDLDSTNPNYYFNRGNTFLAMD
jgi:tetratricopeptide (TPR) repeat protein